MGGDMPLILDEMAKRDGLEFHGIQGGVVIAIQKIRPTGGDRATFPAGLIDKSIGVISVYPEGAGITPIYLNAKQTFEYVMHPQGRGIDIYARPYRYDVKFNERPQRELHIMLYRAGKRFSIGYFELDALKRWIDSVYSGYPEFFT